MDSLCVRRCHTRDFPKHVFSHCYRAQKVENHQINQAPIDDRTSQCQVNLQPLKPSKTHNQERNSLNININKKSQFTAHKTLPHF